jgi:hypothetical protein
VVAGSEDPPHSSTSKAVGFIARGDDANILLGNSAHLGAHGVAVPSDFTNVGGGRQEAFVARDGIVLGAIVLINTICRETNEAIDILNRMGIRRLFLTDDMPCLVSLVGRERTVNSFRCELVPEMEISGVKSFVAEGHVVALVRPAHYMAEFHLRTDNRCGRYCHDRRGPVACQRGRIHLCGLRDHSYFQLDADPAPLATVNTSGPSLGLATKLEPRRLN